MSGNRSRVHALSLILMLALAPMQACGVAAPGNSSPPVSSESPGQYDLTGVWTGTSITGCTPLRMNGPWRCGARADLMLTFIREDTATAITGIYASDRGRDGDAFQETGRIVGVPVSGSHEAVVACKHAQSFELLVQQQFARRGDGGKLSVLP
jgi:hypothetical protein